MNNRNIHARENKNGRNFGAIALSYPPPPPALFFIDDSGAEFHAD